MAKLLLSALVIFLGFLQKGSSLDCWHCSTDLDQRLCQDPFNATEVRRHDPYSNRQYDNQNYNQGYNQHGYNQQGYNQQGTYNSGQSTYNQGGRSNYLRRCEDQDSRMKNMCLKVVKKMQNSNRLSVRRECVQVPNDKQPGTCNDMNDKGTTVEYCQYCDENGCNSATGLKFNFVLFSLAPLVFIWFLRH